MKKKLLTILTVLALVLVIPGFFSGCGIFDDVADYLAAPQGYVYNGKTGEPLADATIQLIDINSGAVLKTATSDYDGWYSFSDVDFGTFELTGQKDGYVFIKQIVSVSGLAQYLPNVAGIDDTDLEPGVLTFIVFWDRNFKDVDAHLTFTSSNIGIATFDNSNFNFISNASDNFQDFVPDLAVTARTHLYYDADVYPSDGTKNPSDSDIWLDVDNKGLDNQPAGGPETFTVFSVPEGITTIYGYYADETTEDADGDYIYTSTGDSDPSKLPAGDYNCVGVMEYYLDAWSADTADSTDPEDGAMLSASDNSGAANPVVYVLDGTNQIARFTLPQYTDIERATIFRVNIFLASDNNTFYYQILPDERVLTDDGSTYANIRTATEIQSGPIVVKAKSRR